MNKYSSIVLWLGLLMIALNLVKDWSSVRNIIFQGSGSTAPASGSGGVNIPLIPVPLPGQGYVGPKIHIG